MKTLALFAAVFLLVTASLTAQTTQSPYRQTLDSLSTAPAEAAIEIPNELFSNPQNTPAGQLQRGLLLYAAAGRAKEMHNTDRAPVLIDASKIQLEAAAQYFATDQNAQKSQCLYYLGLIAEKKEGDIALAKQYYQQAIVAFNNPAAQERLSTLGAN